MSKAYESAIPAREVRRAEQPAGNIAAVDYRRDQRQFFFAPLREIKVSMRHLGRILGVDVIPRCEIRSINHNNYNTSHAQESKTRDLEPNVVVTKEMTAMMIAAKLDTTFGISFDGVRTGVTWLQDMSGQSEEVGDALQYLTLATIPATIMPVFERLRQRLGKTLEQMAQMSKQEVAAEPLSDVWTPERKELLYHKIDEAVRVIRTAPRIRISQDEPASCERIIALTIRAMFEGTRTAIAYARHHARRTERELDNAITRQYGKDIIDEFDQAIYDQLGEAVPEKTSRLAKAQATGAVPLGGPVEDLRPRVECVACSEYILATAKTCRYCGEKQGTPTVAEQPDYADPLPIDPDGMMVEFGQAEPDVMDAAEAEPIDDMPPLLDDFEDVTAHAIVEGLAEVPIPGIDDVILVPPETPGARIEAVPNLDAISDETKPKSGKPPSR